MNLRKLLKSQNFGLVGAILMPLLTIFTIITSLNSSYIDALLGPFYILHVETIQKIAYHSNNDLVVIVAIIGFSSIAGYTLFRLVEYFFKLLTKTFSAELSTFIKVTTFIVFIFFSYLMFLIYTAPFALMTCGDSNSSGRNVITNKCKMFSDSCLSIGYIVDFDNSCPDVPNPPKPKVTSE